MKITESETIVHNFSENSTIESLRAVSHCPALSLMEQPLITLNGGDDATKIS